MLMLSPQQFAKLESGQAPATWEGHNTSGNIYVDIIPIITEENWCTSDTNMITGKLAYVQDVGHRGSA